MRRLLARICTILLLICTGISTSICWICAAAVAALKSAARTRESDPPTTEFPGENRHSDPVQKIYELERKVNMLLARSCSMPRNRDEALNAAVCRVDALEAELISTKKVMFNRRAICVEVSLGLSASMAQCSIVLFCIYLFGRLCMKLC